MNQIAQIAVEILHDEDPDIALYDIPTNKIDDPLGSIRYLVLFAKVLYSMNVDRYDVETIEHIRGQILVQHRTLTVPGLAKTIISLCLGYVSSPIVAAPATNLSLEERLDLIIELTNQ